MERPLILVTNDDGFTAKGIKSLIDAVSEFGDLLIVAPDKPQSGMGHAITIGDTLRLTETDIFKDLGVEAHKCSGTPADCIKIAKHHLLKERSPQTWALGVPLAENWK